MLKRNICLIFHDQIRVTHQHYWLNYISYRVNELIYIKQCWKNEFSYNIIFQNNFSVRLIRENRALNVGLFSKHISITNGLKKRHFVLFTFFVSPAPNRCMYSTLLKLIRELCSYMLAEYVMFRSVTPIVLKLYSLSKWWAFPVVKNRNKHTFTTISKNTI